MWGSFQIFCEPTALARQPHRNNKKYEYDNKIVFHFTPGYYKKNRELDYFNVSREAGVGNPSTVISPKCEIGLSRNFANGKHIPVQYGDESRRCAYLQEYTETEIRTPFSRLRVSHALFLPLSFVSNIYTQVQPRGGNIYSARRLKPLNYRTRNVITLRAKRKNNL